MHSTHLTIPECRPVVGGWATDPRVIIRRSNSKRNDGWFKGLKCLGYAKYGTQGSQIQREERGEHPVEHSRGEEERLIP